MKKLLIIPFLFLSFYNSHAAILVHKSVAGKSWIVDAVSDEVAGHTVTTGNIQPEGNLQQAEEEETQQPAKRRRKGGWPGVISLITGILSLVLWPALIPAIVFGIIGIKPDRKHRNRAETGLIFAGIAVILAIVFLVIGAFPVLAF